MRICTKSSRGVRGAGRRHDGGGGRSGGSRRAGGGGSPRGGRAGGRGAALRLRPRLGRRGRLLGTRRALPDGLFRPRGLPRRRVRMRIWVARRVLRRLDARRARGAHAAAAALADWRRRPPRLPSRHAVPRGLSLPRRVPAGRLLLRARIRRCRLLGGSRRLTGEGRVGAWRVGFGQGKRRHARRQVGLIILLKACSECGTKAPENSVLRNNAEGSAEVRANGFHTIGL